MEGLIELVLNNPILLLLILGYLATLFRGKPDANEQPKKQHRPKPIPPNQTGTPIGKIELEKRPHIEEQVEPKIEPQLSIEEQREQQMQRLQAQFGGSSTYEDMDEVEMHSGLVQKISDREREWQDQQAAALKKNIKQKLNQQGLIESIIMAEVLSRPRAKKRHHRHIT